MALYMLDTNMCIYLMKNQPEKIARRFALCSLSRRHRSELAKRLAARVFKRR